jgi:uncharacterized membrane protein
LYTARGGFLVRPLLIAVFLGAAGMAISWLEERDPTLSGWVPTVLFPSRADPQVAQIILAGIAASIMTVVSIVFAILLMTLTLASMQFSPRILINFIRDRTTQWTLGVFLGTFSYCIAALPAARNLPHPFSPVATVMGAMVLALLCVGWLVFFIQHISQSISVNHIVDRIARDTEEVIDAIMPYPRSVNTRHNQLHPPPREPEVPLPSAVSGYIRYIDGIALRERAKELRVRVRLTRRVGQFVPAGFPLLMVATTRPLSPGAVEMLEHAVDLGATRTLQQDVEFGVLQIVDIALRAISPAVNDPSTAIGCIDQLSRIMIRWISRDPADTHLASPLHVVRVVVPQIATDELLDTAFDQIRHYAVNDVAVTLRLLRAFIDIQSCAADPLLGAQLVERGRRIVDGASKTLGSENIAYLRARLAQLENSCASDALAGRRADAGPATV